MHSRILTAAIAIAAGLAAVAAEAQQGNTINVVVSGHKGQQRQYPLRPVQFGFDLP